MDIVMTADAPRATVVIPPAPAVSPVIVNTFFFPDVDPAQVSERVRLGHVVTDERMKAAIKSAMAEVNAELYLYREQQMQAGFKRLADVPAEVLDGESVTCFHYLSAVCAMTTAVIFERYRSYDASAKGDKKADALEVSVDDQWRDMRWHLSRLQGQPRGMVSQL
ncbi:MAG: head completion/stabilization protein [Ewingella sp.]